MKPSTAIRFVAILAALGAVIALIAFAVSLANRTPQSDTGERKNFFGSLFPFLAGGDGETTAPIIPGGGEEVPEEDARPLPQFHQLSEAPVAGAHLTKGGFVRYVERETGHIFDASTTTSQKTRISNTTMPGVQEALWLGDERYIARFLDTHGTVLNFLVEIATSSENMPVQTRPYGTFAQGDVDANGSLLLATIVTAGGSRVELSEPGKATLPRTVFASPLRSWVPHIAGNSLFVETAPAGVPGFLYAIGANQQLTKLVGDVDGLMSLPSPDGRYIFYSGRKNGVAVASILDRQSATSRFIAPATLADKCAWFPEGEPRLLCGVPKNSSLLFVSGWIDGTTGTEDAAWTVNAATGVSTAVMDLSREADVSFDLIDPMVSTDGTYATFTNKNDLSLWGLRLTATKNTD